ncbi:MAG: translation initiation factor IF-2 subunit alpha [Candidatus Methanomethylicia archaeon]|nr:translation initiation factor IF-2 subunit alpha [Candidatus Methanomethylicia archaeon]
MALRTRDLPEVGELVIATVTKVFDKGAYVFLDEYPDVNGYVPIGEVSSTWVHNIRDYLKEGRKVVLKVIRVDKSKMYADLSLRRVSDKEKKDKLLEWKRVNRGLKLLELLSQRTNVNLDEIQSEITPKLVKTFGDVLAGFEEAARFGLSPIVNAGIPRSIGEIIVDLAKEYIELKEFKVCAILSLSCNADDGIIRIMESLKAAKDALDSFGNVKYRIYAIGAPRYRIDVSAKDYKIAEEALKVAINAVLNKIRLLGGSGSFKRV